MNVTMTVDVNDVINVMRLAYHAGRLRYDSAGPVQDWRQGLVANLGMKVGQTFGTIEQMPPGYLRVTEEGQDRTVEQAVAPAGSANTSQQNPT